MAQSLRVEVVGETNVGRKRTHNEDNFSILEKHGLFIVADGMGGHASGEVASKLAIETMSEFFEKTAEDPEQTWPYKMDRGKGYEENRLIASIKLANLRIFEFAARDAKTRGMGTTLVTMLNGPDGVYCAHVGDRSNDLMPMLTLPVGCSKALILISGECSGSKPMPPMARASWHWPSSVRS